MLDLSGSLFNFVLLIFQKPLRTNVLSFSIVSGRAKDFKCLFRKIRHHFFVESDEFSGEQMTGPGGAPILCLCGAGSAPQRQPLYLPDLAIIIE